MVIEFLVNKMEKAQYFMTINTKSSKVLLA